LTLTKEMEGGRLVRARPLAALPQSLSSLQRDGTPG
jgi:hypothetical protein